MRSKTLEDLNLSLALGSWLQLGEAASKVRFEVFVHEQNVPIEIELDEMDESSLHAVVFNHAHEAVATGRLLPDGHIGRMAVSKSVRGSGVGGIILQTLIEEARQRGYKEVVLSAQLHAMGFYERYGFKAEGDIYLDASIEHKTMRLVF
ncbi:GNAT family N-acetyltransferase [Pelistega ratti]|uniref:GNAT family N-acetyltransferase n=1 Tax=Pelistega ratti TaxID=2652177 RepID=UPI00135A39ED|nr:GNAT family N-acetyltransferase [Pelistega ratti]